MQVELGRLVMTRRISKRTASDPLFAIFISKSLNRFASGDWGDVGENDKLSNDESLKNGSRILAVYTFKRTDEKIWIISERDRSVTAILYPDEY